jgi:cytochrome P450
MAVGLAFTKNTIDWIHEVADGHSYDPVLAQVKLSISSMHTTSDCFTQVLFDICKHPALIEDLRKEIITVRQEHPWGKAAIYHLKLMDSVLKESQRLKPLAISKPAQTRPLTFSST